MMKYTSEGARLGESEWIHLLLEVEINPTNFEIKLLTKNSLQFLALFNPKG